MTTAAKPMTKAQETADKFRDAREMREGVEKRMADDYSCVVYLYENNGHLCAAGYRGRAQKQAFRFRYATAERREEHIAKFVEENAKKKGSRSGAPRALKVGDVLRASWGYDQTNIDYYLVTELVGKASVEIVEIGAMSETVGADYGSCVPDVTRKIGAPMKKRVSTYDGKSVRINSCTTARLKQPEAVVNGVAVYGTDGWTSGR